MSRITRAFEQGKAFIGFVTGGDPSIEKTGDFVRAMIRAGAALVEIGIPFSDPVAEGPVIQAANLRALAGGATVDQLFDLAAQLRGETETPLVFLTYLNPVFQYGYGAFFRRCRESGVDGLIIPDLPFEEHGEVRGFAVESGVDLISLVAPTSEERVQEIARTATGFLYVVSSLGVTGVRGEIKTDLAAIITSARKSREPQSLPLPIAVGFGIHSSAQAAEIAQIADGVIVGSAIVKLIETHGENAASPIYRFVKEITQVL